MKIQVKGFNLTVELSSYEMRRLLACKTIADNESQAKMLVEAEDVLKEASNAYACARIQIEKLNKKFNEEE